MADSATKRYAVVTGANKGIGLEICKQLASEGVIVVLTARDEKRGFEALEKFKGSALSDLVVFHQLDVVDSSSVASLAEFVKNQFGRLDILVNNAAISALQVDADTLSKAAQGLVDWNKVSTSTHELAVECLETNYYGVKRMIQRLIPLLQLSPSPRIVNVSSSMGKLKNIPDGWAKGILSDAADSLTEEKVDELVSKFLNDFKEGSTNGWPTSVYVVSKAVLNAYTRAIAKKYPSICISCVCPGYCKTDLNHNTGILSAEEGAQTPVKVALLPDGSPSGLFYNKDGLTSFDE